MADTACKNFVMKVVDETWYKELKDLDTFYTNFTALKILDHITDFFQESTQLMLLISPNL